LDWPAPAKWRAEAGAQMAFQRFPHRHRRLPFQVMAKRNHERCGADGHEAESVQHYLQAIHRQKPKPTRIVSLGS